MLISLKAAFGELCEWLSREMRLRNEAEELVVVQQYGYLQAAEEIVSQLFTGCSDLGIFGDEEEEEAEPDEY